MKPRHAVTLLFELGPKSAPIKIIKMLLLIQLGSKPLDRENSSHHVIQTKFISVVLEYV